MKKPALKGCVYDFCEAYNNINTGDFDIRKYFVKKRNIA